MDYIYKKRGKVTLNREQTELALELIKKERHEIQKKKQEVINNAAKDGATISTASALKALDELLKEHQGDEEFIGDVRKFKKNILEKYGEQIPVDVAYKIVDDYEAKHGLLD